MSEILYSTTNDALGASIVFSHPHLKDMVPTFLYLFRTLQEKEKEGYYRIMDFGIDPGIIKISLKTWDTSLPDWITHHLFNHTSIDYRVEIDDNVKVVTNDYKPVDASGYIIKLSKIQ